MVEIYIILRLCINNVYFEGVLKIFLEDAVFTTELTRQIRIEFNGESEGLIGCF